ncbi:MAG: hypothetical protein LBI69_05185 [Puniceicoccales bacterium]|jgi:hypothetical protein|nr:hypothetical protein [Puniceicoccales bacterium]
MACLQYQVNGKISNMRLLETEQIALNALASKCIHKQSEESYKEKIILGLEQFDAMCAFGPTTLTVDGKETTIKDIPGCAVPKRNFHVSK